MLIGDQQGFLIRLDDHAVEQFQPVAGTGAADFDPAMQPIQIESVHRLAEFQHDVVGDINQRPQTSHPGPAQAFLHPQRRSRGGINAANHPTDITRAIGWIEQGHRKSCGNDRIDDFHRQRAKFATV